MTNLQQEDINKLKEVIDGCSSYDTQLYTIHTLVAKLGVHYTYVGDVSSSTFRYWDEFLQSALSSLDGGDNEVAYILLKRLLYHHKPILQEQQWWELGETANFYD